MGCPIKCPEMVLEGVKKEQFRSLGHLLKYSSHRCLIDFYVRMSHRFFLSGCLIDFYVSCLIELCQFCGCGQGRCLHKNKGLGRFIIIWGAPDPNSASSHRPSADRGVKEVRGGGFNF